MFKVRVNNDKVSDIFFDDYSFLKGKINGKDFSWDIQLLKNVSGYYHIIKDDSSFNTSVLDFDEDNKSFTISVRGNVYQVSVKDENDELLENLGLTNVLVKKTNELRASMPGLVKEIFVEEGDSVMQGQSLLILEAMKMENAIKASADLIIRSIEVSAGSAVDKNQLLMKFG